MFRYLLSLLYVITFTTSLFAQPGVAFMNMYDEDNRSDIFNDIYAVSDGSYIMCGSSYQQQGGSQDQTRDIWVVKINNDGDVIWSGRYGSGDRRDESFTVIETDGGEFLIGSESDGDVAALLLDDEGEQIWFNTYVGGKCYAAIELKSDEFLLAGWSREPRGAYLLCINGDGDVLWDETYQVGSMSYFYSMRETQGGVVVTGYSYFPDDRPVYQVWVVKVNIEEEGEIIWSEHLAPENCQRAFSMVSAQEGGFLLAGHFWNGDGNHDADDFLQMKIDSEGNLQWYVRRDVDGDNLADRCFCVARLDHGDYALVGYKNSNAGQLPQVIRTASDGAERWHSVYELPWDNGYSRGGHYLMSVVNDNDNSIIAAGMAQSRGQDLRNGFVMKLEPDILEPLFLFYSPEDTILSVLQGDSVEFMVEAIGYRDRELSYLWIMGEDTLSHDSTTTVVFDSLGVFDVQNQVTDGEFTASITWHISVVEFYITGFEPDTLEMTVRRNSSIDFSIEARMLEDIEVNCLWTLSGRGQSREVGEEDSVTVLFDLTGDYRLAGLIYRGNAEDAMDWIIHVHSVVWHWWPHEQELSVSIDTQMDFMVFPFDDESDSLSFQWLLNDDPLEVDTTADAVIVEFPLLGLQTLTSIVQDGVEVDTIIWQISVFDPRGVTDDMADWLPETVSLSAPSPNPFNAVTRIDYALPQAGWVNLTVYNVNGQLVKKLVNEHSQPGRYSIAFDADNLQAGLYFVRLETGSFSLIRKAIVLK
ncbi:MAG: T9SS type A sorting domain-containing protein [Candidatus Hatepunaea meridiana]|nr:T9SS type A sorting domain-containing protein [Candidatus Hatepunaea meridiana]